MAAYQVVKSEEFLEKIATRFNSPTFARVLAGLIEEISESPRSRGGKFCGQWAYPLLVYQIKAAIGDDNKTVTLTDIFRLP